MCGREKETELYQRAGEFSEKTWWHIDYGTDVAPGVVLMTAVLGG